MRTLKGKFLSIFVALVALNATGTLVITWTVSAQKADSTVINLAGAQRMLSQRMSKDALLLAQGQGDAGALRKSMARFTQVLKGLARGDAELGIPPCQDREILEHLAAVEQLWIPFQTALTGLAGAGASRGHLKTTVDLNLRLLERMDTAVKLFEGRAQA